MNIGPKYCFLFLITGISITVFSITMKKMMFSTNVNMERSLWHENKPHLEQLD